MIFLDRDEIYELNEETRKRAVGLFVQLPNGFTHYELGGNESGEVVVLVHGFSIPYFIYDPAFQFLTESGFRVLRYDLFGRGFSDRPRAAYNIHLFVQQLADLLDALRFTKPVNLIGLSMGGPIAATFAVQYPERVKKLVLIDPAGARSIRLSPVFRMAKIPFVAEAILSSVGSERLAINAAKDLFDPALVDHFKSSFQVQLQYKGFKRAILSTIRNGMLDSFVDVYEALGKLDQQVLLFWGRQDNTVPFEHSEILCRAMPQAQLYVVENCGHIPHYEKPDEVNPVLLEFLRRP